MQRHVRIAIVLSGMAAGGCTTPARNTDLSLPDRYALAREQLLIHSDFPLPAQHRLLEELAARRTDVALALGLPVSNEPIQVYLFEDIERFRAYVRMEHPEFPERRAFFVETDTRLIVYAHWGDRVAEDLRHEMTHGYVHSVVPELPLWLDEGLAEYFEVRRGDNGLNRAHLSRMLARLDHGSWQPDLARLERLDPSAALEISQDDYAESWAWVHFLLRSRPEHAQLLRSYMAELHRNGRAPPLSSRLASVLAQPNHALTEHIRWLGAMAPKRTVAWSQALTPSGMLAGNL